MSQEKVVLAVDYGTKRLGLAVTHSSLALPLEVIEYQDPQEAIDRIAKICLEHKVSIIVLGLSENVMAEKTRNFGRILENNIDLPIDYVDETLSSSEVRKRFKHRKKHVGSRPIDHYAAALILQEWLDTKNDLE